LRVACIALCRGRALVARDGDAGEAGPWEIADDRMRPLPGVAAGPVR